MPIFATRWPSVHPYPRRASPGALSTFRSHRTFKIGSKPADRRGLAPLCAGGRVAHDEFGRDHDPRGRDVARDAIEEGVQASSAELGKILAYRGERRREVGGFGDVVETDDTQVA